MKEVAEIERLKAQVDALLKAREVLNERISSLSEKIGELRSSLIEHIRDTAELEAKMKQTIELVQKSEPEKILKEVTLFNSKIEALKARIDSFETLINRVIDEMKEMRRTFIQFKSLETLTKIAEDLKKSIEKGKRVEVEISKKSSKVEAIYYEISKKYKELLNTIRISEELKEMFKNVLSEFNKLRISIVNLAKKEEIEELKKYLENNLKESKELNEELKKRREELKEIIFSSKAMAEISEKVSSMIEEKKFINEKLKTLDELINSFNKLKVDVEKISNKIDSFEEMKKKIYTKEEIEVLKEKIEQKLLKIDEIYRKIKEKEKILNSEIEKIEKIYEKIEKLEKLQNNLLKIIEEIV